MNDIYYFDKPIYSDDIRKYCVSNKYSEIRIGNKTTQDLIQNILHPQEIIYFDDLTRLDHHELSEDNEIYILSASVFAEDLSALAKFIKFTSFSMINTLWGNKNCFIYKGNKNQFLSFYRNEDIRDIYFVNFPKFILDLTSLPELKLVLSNSHDSRHFNEIKNVGDTYIKKSLDSTKLKSEYDFLNNVPVHLKNYFVQVFEFNQEPDFSQYSMVSYDYKDLSYLVLSNSLNKESCQILMTLIQKYFNDAKMDMGLAYEKKSLDNLIKKNSTRLDQIKKINFYNSLNNFLLNFSGISIIDHHLRIQKELKKRKTKYEKENYIFSHGDLCFSNILFSPQNKEIKLIDPKGYENNGMRSPYYDMAKLSHSILGYYDLIINNRAKIDFDIEMNAFLNFDKLESIKDFEFLLEKLVHKLKLDWTLVRLIESSLFLSMIPFHIENKNKVFMLCLRSVEIFEEL